MLYYSVQDFVQGSVAGITFQSLSLWQSESVGVESTLCCYADVSLSSSDYSWTVTKEELRGEFSTKLQMNIFWSFLFLILILALVILAGLYNIGLCGRRADGQADEHSDDGCAWRAMLTTCKKIEHACLFWLNDRRIIACTDKVNTMKWTLVERRSQTADLRQYNRCITNVKPFDTTLTTLQC